MLQNLHCNIKLSNVLRTAALPIAKRVGKQILKVRNLGQGRNIPSTLQTVLLFAPTTTLVVVPSLGGQVSLAIRLFYLGVGTFPFFYV